MIIQSVKHTLQARPINWRGGRPDPNIPPPLPGLLIRSPSATSLAYVKPTSMPVKLSLLLRSEKTAKCMRAWAYVCTYQWTLNRFILLLQRLL